MESVSVLNSRSRLVFLSGLSQPAFGGCGGQGYGTYCRITKNRPFKVGFSLIIGTKRETIRSHLKRGAAPVGTRFLVSVQFRLKIADNRYIPVKPFLNSAIQCG
jgi:hypothetical protein